MFTQLWKIETLIGKSDRNWQLSRALLNYQRVLIWIIKMVLWYNWQFSSMWNYVTELKMPKHRHGRIEVHTSNTLQSRLVNGMEHPFVGICPQVSRALTTLWHIFVVQSLNGSDVRTKYGTSYLGVQVSSPSQVVMVLGSSVTRFSSINSRDLVVEHPQ